MDVPLAARARSQASKSASFHNRRRPSDVGAGKPSGPTFACATCGSRWHILRASVAHLLANILPQFTAKTGITVKVVAGRAGIHRRGLWHDMPVDRVECFVVVGPSSDPAHIIGGTDAAALTAIAVVCAPFVSRGDRSDNNIGELRLWRGRLGLGSAHPLKNGITPLVAESRRCWARQHDECLHPGRSCQLAQRQQQAFAGRRHRGRCKNCSTATT